VLQQLPSEHEDRNDYDYDYERGSAQAAAALAQRFGADYPPSHDIHDYRRSLSRKARMDEKNAYNTCNDAHNLGLTLLKTPSGEPGISCRWHTARDAYLDAIDLAMKKAPGSFLTTHGEDHRRLLSKIAVAMALLRLRVLDAPGLLAWGRVAVAADPTYFNGHSRVSSGLQHVGRYEEALAEARVAQELAEPEWKRKTSLGIAPLEKIVAGSKEEKKAAIMDFLEEKRRIAFSYWQEMGVSKPAKSCALCFWDAENKCARCRTVYYCQRECQVKFRTVET
jgi:hypothetical protein